MGVTLIKQPIYSNFLKTALKLSFDFFQNLLFQNLSYQTWGATHLWVQLTCQCLQYLSYFYQYLKWHNYTLWLKQSWYYKISYMLRERFHLDKLLQLSVINQLWSYHFSVSWEISMKLEMRWKLAQCFNLTDLRDVLIWGCSKAIEGISTAKSTAFHWDHQRGDIAWR